MERRTATTVGAKSPTLTTPSPSPTPGLLVSLTLKMIHRKIVLLTNFILEVHTLVITDFF